MAKPTKVYPVKGRYLSDVPAVVTLVSTKADAEDLIASGAFTDNPNDAERDTDAPDTTSDGPVDPAQTSFQGEEE